jgi:SAM-dependent methyltransferase
VSSELPFHRQDVVDQWQRERDARSAEMAGITAALFELAAIRAGMRVLDVGAGVGEIAIEAAGLVGPAGRVLAVDVSGPMVAALRGNVAQAGVANVEARHADMRDLDMVATFDAAIARHSIMLVDDIDASLAAIRRALRARGRLAASVWSAGERNPLIWGPYEVVRALGEEPAPRVADRLNDPERLRAALERAGFRDVSVRFVAIATESASLDEQLAAMRGAPSVARAWNGLTEEQRRRAWELLRERWQPYERTDGFTLPGECLVAGATA